MYVYMSIYVYIYVDIIYSPPLHLFSGCVCTALKGIEHLKLVFVSCLCMNEAMFT